MGTRVRSYAKVNLGLAIGPVREDGFHGLVTLYQTLDLYDYVTVSARLSRETRISLTSDHPRVPCDGRNTAWKMVEGALMRLGVAAEVSIHIEKKLPVQGGMGAGSANAAAALIGLERELGVRLEETGRMAVAAEVGSDVPLFLVGGAVLGEGRGELVSPMPDFRATACVVAVPALGVSTPRAFREWDQRYAARHGETAARLTPNGKGDTLGELSRVYASVFRETERMEAGSGTSGIVRKSRSDSIQPGTPNGLAENTLLSLVHAGIENDFEEVVFSQYPSLREIKHELMGTETDSPALYAALSGSGSALFGLYGSVTEARAAQQRVQASGVKALTTETLPRAEYWRRMIAGSPHREQRS